MEVSLRQTLRILILELGAQKAAWFALVISACPLHRMRSFIYADNLCAAYVLKGRFTSCLHIFISRTRRNGKSN